VLRSRLRKVDASSPRAALRGFLDSINGDHALVTEGNAKLKAEG
jgi:hypothetical protein